MLILILITKIIIFVIYVYAAKLFLSKNYKSKNYLNVNKDFNLSSSSIIIYYVTNLIFIKYNLNFLISIIVIISFLY